MEDLCIKYHLKYIFYDVSHMKEFYQSVHKGRTKFYLLFSAPRMIDFKLFKLNSFERETFNTAYLATHELLHKKYLTTVSIIFWLLNKISRKGRHSLIFFLSDIQKMRIFQIINQDNNGRRCLSVLLRWLSTALTS